MAKYIKFNDVASSANVASTFLYVEVDSIKYIDTASTSVVIYCTGRGADGGSDDTVTITCTAGDEAIIADRIIRMANSQSHGEVLRVDKDFQSGISDISPNVV
jgi:hypothetical protein|tara:strand:+ start:28 stop:336 length:309 start_codon:yes stop_codon:yes gene_type:complete